MPEKKKKKIDITEEQAEAERLAELDKTKIEDMHKDQMIEYLELCGHVFEGPEEADEYWVKTTVVKERASRTGKYEKGFFTTIEEEEEAKAAAHDAAIDPFIEYQILTNFVDFYNLTMDMRTDAHDHYKIAIALYLISTLCMWKFKLLDMRELSVYDESLDYLPLNAWFMFIGKSRLARKSTVINIARGILDRITEERIITNTRIKPKQSYQVNALLPDSFTPEALVGCLQDRCWEYFSGAGSIGERTHATWINDEVSYFWSKLAKQDYMSGTPEILAKIYDCPKYYKASTIQRGQETIRYPYLTMCVGSTEVLPTFFNELQLRQGFLNRYFFILDKDREMIKAPMKDFDKRMRLIRGWLTALYNVKVPVTMVIHPDVQNELDKFEKAIYKELKKGNLGIEEGYTANLPNYLRKLAGLYRISRLSIHELDEFKRKPDTLGIEMRDYKRAMGFLKILRKDFIKVLELVRVRYYQKPVVTQESEMIKIWSTIAEMYIQNKNKWVSKTQIIRKTRMTGEDIARTLNDLYLGKYIDRKEEKTTTKHRNVYRTLERPKFE